MLKKLFKELSEEYNKQYKISLDKINTHKSKMYRFWHKFGLIVLFSWKWLFKELTHLKTIIVFILVALIMSATVWIPFIVAIIFGFNSNVGISSMGIVIGSLIFWNLPGTPFIIMCLTITLLLNRTLLAKWQVKDINFRKIFQKHKV